jgi:hypothetical protein
MKGRGRGRGERGREMKERGRGTGNLSPRFSTLFAPLETCVRNLALRLLCKLGQLYLLQVSCVKAVF